MTTTMASVYPSLENRPIQGTICLFDVDETLTPSRKVSLSRIAGKICNIINLPMNRKVHLKCWHYFHSSAINVQLALLVSWIPEASLIVS